MTTSEIAVPDPARGHRPQRAISGRAAAAGSCASSAAWTAATTCTRPRSICPIDWSKHLGVEAVSGRAEVLATTR